MFEEIAKKYGEEYLLRQLAEECSELAQAALKCIRAKRGETPMGIEAAMAQLTEEVADVIVNITAIMEGMLSVEQCFAVNDMEEAKLERWRQRMLDGEDGRDADALAGADQNRRD